MEGVRGFAVILVFFVHYHSLFSHLLYENSFNYHISNFLGTVGSVGVDLFFVLSGYLIYGAVVRKPVRYVDFARRRVERIYPTFLAVFAIYLIFSLALPRESKIPSGAPDAVVYILANICLLPGLFNITPIITVAWSLSFEFLYYLTLPLIVSLSGMRGWRRRVRVCFFISLAVVGFVGLARASGSHLRLIMFLPGILVYEAIGTGARRRSERIPGETVAAVAFLASFPLHFALTSRRDLVTFLPGIHTLGGSYGVLVLFVSFLGFAFFCLGQEGFLSRLFSWTPLRWLGNMSYSYYLSHGLVLKFIAFIVPCLFSEAGSSPAVFWSLLPVAISATLASSTLLFVTVERPFSLRTAGLRRAPP
jgi:peptidoglycan/LPS O-acetylase OafA/YrhL